VVAVLKYHVIDGRRCEVKKALTKSEMNSVKSVTAAASSAPALVGGMNQDYGAGANMPYGMPAGNMGGWLQGPWNTDENAAAAAPGNYGYPGAPCNHNANTPYGMNFGNMAGMIGSMLAASMGAQGLNMAGGYPGQQPGPGGYPGQNAGNMTGQNCFVIFHFIHQCVIVVITFMQCSVVRSYCYQ